MKIKFTINFKHKRASFGFNTELFRLLPSFYNYPFVSWRWLGFELIVDCNKVGESK